MSDYFLSSEYPELKTLVAEKIGGLSLAELHGMILGYLAATPHPSFKEWKIAMDDVLSYEPQEQETVEHVLARLFLQSHMDLQQNKGYTLCLPSDQTPLAEQIIALAECAYGILYGLGLASAEEDLEGIENLEELFSDLTALAHLDHHFSQDETSVEDFQACLNHLIFIIKHIYQAQKEQ